MTTENNIIYVSPQVKTVVINVQAVVCTSYGLPTETDEENDC